MSQHKDSQTTTTQPEFHSNPELMQKENLPHTTQGSLENPHYIWMQNVIQAARDMREAINHNLDTKEAPLKYTVPYGIASKLEKLFQEEPNARI